MTEARRELRRLVIHAAGLDTLSSFLYTLDDRGNRAHAVETLATPSGGGGWAVTVTVIGSVKQSLRPSTPDSICPSWHHSGFALGNL